ncbi:MAG TPA: cysteine--tRNA ligase [Candidatus Woesebacteria bacterium]|nr:cysteine--tRNA ligase [Candidatus Woesebacteria bacterium]
MKLYNTLSRQIEQVFSPSQQKDVSFYACGPTVYDETHIGHMRKYIMDDILKRSLNYLGYNVHHVMNITDVGHLSGDDDSGEDKLEKGAKKQGRTVWDVAKYYTNKFFETTDALNIERPTVVKATEHIPQMIALIQKLQKKGFTYETKEAIYFDVTKFPDYGKLSGQKLEDKKQAVREEVNVDPDKKHPADFALWFKRVGRFADHTMHWESPWGDGFPGWHIECSAMSMDALHTEQIDIHTGGIDHIPVHHENEIAQSEAATGKHPFVKYWVHHAFLKVNGEKMSKSKENFYTLKDLEEHNIDPLAIRYLFLQTHYRQEMNFTWEAAQAAQTSLNKLRNIITELKKKLSTKETDFTKFGNASKDGSYYEQRYKESLENDINTSSALATFWAMIQENDLPPEEKISVAKNFDQVFGLQLFEYQVEAIPENVINIAEKRKKAKLEKDYTKSDELRKEIEKMGYEIEDTIEGYKIRTK